MTGPASNFVVRWATPVCSAPLFASSRANDRYRAVTGVFDWVIFATAACGVSSTWPDGVVGGLPMLEIVVESDPFENEARWDTSVRCAPLSTGRMPHARMAPPAPKPGPEPAPTLSAVSVPVCRLRRWSDRVAGGTMSPLSLGWSLVRMNTR